jgi:hypothetical protein
MNAGPTPNHLAIFSPPIADHTRPVAAVSGSLLSLFRGQYSEMILDALF